MEKRPTTQPPLELTHNSHFDLIIIGAGINGAAVARDAALRGLTVCLLEKNTFASGTSSKSSKLAHGGLRYLEQFEFSLVQESLREREYLFKNAPQYVKPLEFLYPIYNSSSRPLWKIRLGMWIYSLLAHNSILPKYQMVSKTHIQEQFPHLNTENLKGGARYFDGQMHDYNCVIANIIDAKTHNTQTYEHTTVTELIKNDDKLCGVKVSHNNTTLDLFAPCIINTSGPWCNKVNELDDPDAPPIVAPTKGVHLIVPSLGLEQALILETPQDKRIFFIIPWENNTLIGTTDTPFNGNPNQVKVDPKDINYLLTATNHYLKTPIKKEDIIDQYAGLRPLQYSKKSASKRSRDFSLLESDSGLLHLFGGKYTSFRHMAEITVNYILKSQNYQKKLSKCSTLERPLP